MLRKNSLIRKKFKHSVDVANAIIEESSHVSLDSFDHPIYKVINIFARAVQYNFLQYVITTHEYEIPHQRDVFLFHPNYHAVKEQDIPTEIYSEMYTDETTTLDFSKDLVLSFPWSLKRFYPALKNIKNGHWEYDSLNHQAYYLEPFKIGVIANGYHSSTFGILTSQGTLPAKIQDMSVFYKWVYTDGVYYYNANTNQKINKVNSFEEAVIYEIGRLIHNKKT